jgi:hypothetical protein
VATVIGDSNNANRPNTTSQTRIIAVRLNSIDMVVSCTQKPRDSKRFNEAVANAALSSVGVAPRLPVPRLGRAFSRSSAQAAYAAVVASRAAFHRWPHLTHRQSAAPSVS